MWKSKWTDWGLHAKAKQVPDAIKKANELARRKFIKIPLRDGRTIHHDVYSKDGAGKVILDLHLKVQV